jgi:hypothetical protein
LSAPPQRFPPRRTGYATDGQTSAWTRTDERSRRSKHRPRPTTTPWPGAHPEPAWCANEQAAPAQPAAHPSSPKPQPQPQSHPHHNRSLFKRHTTRRRSGSPVYAVGLRCSPVAPEHRPARNLRECVPPGRTRLAFVANPSRGFAVCQWYLVRNFSTTSSGACGRPLRGRPRRRGPGRSGSPHSPARRNTAPPYPPRASLPQPGRVKG